MMNNLFNRVQFYKKALDGAWKNHEAISNNIANVNTPNYKRQSVNFKDVLAQEMNSGFKFSKSKGNSFIGNNSIETISKNNLKSTRVDNSGIDPDVEMAELAKNTIYYNAVSKQLTAEIKRLSAAIKDGR